MNAEQFLSWLSHSESDTSSWECTRRPLVMGILNVTPDSFYDGGRYFNPNDACERAACMIAEGVDLIDVGGESSKPGATPTPLADVLARVIPVIEQLRAKHDVCISIDTSSPAVMRAAVAAGASFINDINALRAEGALSTAAALGVPVCLMHMQGTPDSMQVNPLYAHDVVDEINTFFDQRIDACVRAGIPRHHLLLDPGFGFGKLVSHNLTLVKRLGEFHQHRLPVLLGVSRKSTIGAVLQKITSDRLYGGLATAAFAVLHGAGIIRTHDVTETQQVLSMVDAIRQCGFNELGIL